MYHLVESHVLIRLGYYLSCIHSKVGRTKLVEP